MLNIPDVSSGFLGMYVHDCWLFIAFNPFRRCQEEEEEEEEEEEGRKKVIMQLAPCRA